MGNLFLIFLTAVFAVIILYDVLGHRHGPRGAEAHQVA